LKKRGIIGIGIVFLVLSIIVGIASIPDEVLIESTTNKNSQILSDAQAVPNNEDINNFIKKSEVDKNLENTNTELKALKKEITELKNELSRLKVVPTVSAGETVTANVEDGSPENKTEGRVFTVKLHSGIGATHK
jgi:cell shape-determining protein MreC